MTGAALSKRRLLDSLAGRLESIGYLRTPGSVKGSSLVEHKHQSPLILSLGIEFSRRFTDRFTGSFYLSRSHEWAYVVKGFPRQAYQRVGHFLSRQERAELLEHEFRVPGVVDAWWIGFSEASVDSFLAAVAVTEPRFVAQSGLTEALLKCEGVSLHWGMIQDTIKEKTSHQTSLATVEPRAHSREVPSEWLLAAESVLVQKRPESANSNYIALLAGDAWRQSICPIPHYEE